MSVSFVARKPLVGATLLVIAVAQAFHQDEVSVLQQFAKQGATAYQDEVSVIQQFAKQGATAARSRTSISVPIHKRVLMQSGQKSEVFYGSIQIGTPPQEFVVTYDTGSGNLVLPGSECTSQACLNHHRYSSLASSTSRRTRCWSNAAPHAPPAHRTNDASFLEDEEEEDEDAWTEDSDEEVTIGFGTGQIEGACVRDQVCIGEICTEVPFIAAVDESAEPFNSLIFDGILGLSLPAMSMDNGAFNLFSHFRPHLESSLFTVYFAYGSDGSEITFGRANEDHMASELFWVPLSGKFGYWEVEASDISVGGHETGLCDGSCRVAVDTGTTMLAGPRQKVEALRKILNVKQDCDGYEGLPNLGFVIAGRVLNLNKEDYVDSNEGSCALSLMTVDVPPPKGPLFIFGVPFMRRYTTVYDFDADRVGFAMAKHPGREAEAIPFREELEQGRAAPADEVGATV